MVDQMMELLTQRKSAGASLARPAKTAKTSRTTARPKSVSPPVRVPSAPAAAATG